MPGQSLFCKSSLTRTQGTSQNQCSAYSILRTYYPLLPPLSPNPPLPSAPPQDPGFNSNGPWGHESYSVHSTCGSAFGRPHSCMSMVQHMKLGTVNNPVIMKGHYTCTRTSMHACTHRCTCMYIDIYIHKLSSTSTHTLRYTHRHFLTQELSLSLSLYPRLAQNSM